MDCHASHHAGAAISACVRARAVGPRRVSMRDSNGPAHRRDHRQLARLLGMVPSRLHDSMATPSNALDAHTCLRANSLPSLRDCHIEAIPDGEVNVVGQLLFSLVSSLIRTKVVPSLPSICTLDLESDFRVAIGSNAWCSIHPCMHWCGYEGLMSWTQDQGQNTCPVCRTVIQFMLVTENPRMSAA